MGFDWDGRLHSPIRTLKFALDWPLGSIVLALPSPAAIEHTCQSMSISIVVGRL